MRKLLVFAALTLAISQASAAPIETNVRYGDRFYLASVLTGIFGKESENLVASEILDHYEIFGGPCSLMEDNYVDVPGLQEPKQAGSIFACRKGHMETKAQSFARSELLRSSQIHKVCKELTEEPELIRNALAGTFPYTDRAQAVKVVAKKFYPSMQNAEELGQQIAARFSGTTSFDSFYKKIVHSFCISDQWQVPSISQWASGADKYSTDHFRRCHAVFVREPASFDNPLLLAVAAKKMTSTDACMSLVSQAKFVKAGTIQNPKENVVGQKVLRTFQAFHGSWFQSHLTDMTSDGPETFDLVELEEPALFVTRAMFEPKGKFRDVLSGKTSYEGIRVSEVEPQYLVGAVSEPKLKIKPYFESGLAQSLVRWNPHRLDRGTLVGIRAKKKNQDMLPSFVDDLRYPHKIETPPIDIHASLGGGFIGTNSYLIFNMGRILGEVSDGGAALPRRLAKNLINDILCRDIPVIAPDDSLKYLSPKPGLTWTEGKSCMGCHATMDTMAGLFRNGQLVLTRNDGEASYHVRLHDPIPGKRLAIYEKDPLFHKSMPSGRFVYRSTDGKFVDKALNSVDELGATIAGLDDFYRCATSRYFYFLTGIKVPVASIDEKTLNPKQKKIVADFNRWSGELKKTQRLDGLVKNIVDSIYFRASDLSEVSISERSFESPER